MSETTTEKDPIPVTGNDDHGEPPLKRRRFETFYADDAELELPNDMAEYFLKQTKNLVKPAELEEHITSSYPTPKNLGKVKMLDELKELLAEQGKKAIVDRTSCFRGAHTSP